MRTSRLLLVLVVIVLINFRDVQSRRHPIFHAEITFPRSIKKLENLIEDTRGFIFPTPIYSVQQIIKTLDALEHVLKNYSTPYVHVSNFDMEEAVHNLYEFIFMDYGLPIDPHIPKKYTR